ncbi:hypothetical protein [Geodermatophilus saharensis]|uniref:hypothetical protein n=1 Tax=Geodermatophilus saharensis TaxID=1137994 RepID=UPI001C3E81DB|nr:hypothetical protein [Geodermatophilus saharensis]
MATATPPAPSADGAATTATTATTPGPRPGADLPDLDLPPVGGPVWVAWREGTLTRAAELEALCAWVQRSNPRSDDEALVLAIRRHLTAAREAARVARLNPHRRFRLFRNGPLIERATSNLDAAEAHLLNLLPPAYVLGQMPCLLRHVQCHLPPTDPRRQEFEAITGRLGIRDPDHPQLRDSVAVTPEAKLRIVDDERRKIVTIVRGASSAALREHVRLRSFRNVVVATTVFMTALAIAVAVTGFLHQTLFPLCFAPEETGIAAVVCPTNQSGPFIPLGGQPQPGIPLRDIDDVTAETARPQDLIVVELVGLTAAAIASAAAIRRMKGSSERYGLPVALAALKLPTGAVTAFLGLLLMRGQFIPGLSALDTSAQILAWALVFGYAQQLFTRLVDQQGQTVLDSVRGADRPQRGPDPA